MGKSLELEVAGKKKELAQLNKKNISLKGFIRHLLKTMESELGTNFVKGSYLCQKAKKELVK